MEPAWSSETLVSYHISSPWRWRLHGPPKLWYPTTSIHPEDGGSMVLRNFGILPYLFTLKMEAAWSSETLVSYHIFSPWRWRQHGPLKRWYSTTRYESRRSRSECSFQFLQMNIGLIFQNRAGRLDFSPLKCLLNRYRVFLQQSLRSWNLNIEHLLYEGHQRFP